MWEYIIHMFPFWKVQRFSKEAYDSPKTTWNLWAGDKLFLSILVTPSEKRDGLFHRAKSSNKQMEQVRKTGLLHAGPYLAFFPPSII